jgi:hypothetical protein
VLVSDFGFRASDFYEAATLFSGQSRTPLHAAALLAGGSPTSRRDLLRKTAPALVSFGLGGTRISWLKNLTR